MRSAILLCLSVCAFVPALTMADQVIREVPETTAGKGYGALTGLMIGAAAGPIGAIAGAGAGFWMGGTVQEASDLSGTAYEIESSPMPASPLARRSLRKAHVSSRNLIDPQRLIPDA